MHHQKLLCMLHSCHVRILACCVRESALLKKTTPHMRPSLVIRCLPAYLLETSPSYFSIPFCASQKPYQTALSYLSYLSHLFILVMCLKCLFPRCKFMCAARSRNCGKCSTVCATAPYMH